MQPQNFFRAIHVLTNTLRELAPLPPLPLAPLALRDANLFVKFHHHLNLSEQRRYPARVRCRIETRS